MHIDGPAFVRGAAPNLLLMFRLDIAPGVLTVAIIGEASWRCGSLELMHVTHPFDGSLRLNR
jgi:hypothetical protein